MAYRRKRITRKDIRRPDHFITLTADLVDFASRHRTRLLVLLLLILGALSTIWILEIYTTSQNRQASERYFRALSLYEAGNYRAASEAFRNVASYRSSTYKTAALIQLANTQIVLNESAQAVSTLEGTSAVTHSEPLLRQTALLTLGHAKELSSGCKEAIGHFLAAETAPGPLKEEATLSVARCAAANGDLKQSLAAYKRYLGDYPDSDRVTEVILRVHDLEGKKPAQS